MTDENFSLLVVCQANVCRSPMAERLARHVLAERLDPARAGFTVLSAGTHARTGSPMHPHVRTVLVVNQQLALANVGHVDDLALTELVERDTLVTVGTEAAGTLPHSAGPADPPAAADNSQAIAQIAQHVVDVSRVGYAL